MIIGFNLFPFNKPQHDINFLYNRAEPITIASAFKTWDAQQYIFLAENGYHTNSPLNLVIYPLYPFLIKVFEVLFLNNSLLCGLVLSNFFSFIAIIFFYYFVEKLFSPKTAFIASVLLLSFPTAFYMSLVYTEALFLMLVLIFFYFLYVRKHFAAFVAAFFLPLTRPQGILVAVSLTVFIVSKLIKRGSNRKDIFCDCLLLFAFMGGEMVYLIFMKHLSGAYFTGFEAQKYYLGHASIGNIFDLHSWFLRNFVHIKFAFHGFTTSSIDRLFFCSFLLLLWPMCKDLDKTLFFYAVVICLIPALSDSFMAYSRYVLPAFPLFIVLAKRLNNKSYFLALLMFVSQLVFLLAHSLNYWIA
ncbi:MAG: glycosyltransferase family 39 protein [Candidatus Omnitrophica bacterium]|nr:glycosyltransferase family 39 protein [Candidatus Omnitrophota bacterium]